MTCRQKRALGLIVALAVLPTMILVGCASQKALWGKTADGLVLEYHMPTGKALKYQTMNTSEQKMEVMGQKVEVTSEGVLTFSAASKGVEEGVNKVGMTVESLTLEIVSPQGSMNPDLSAVSGKSFDMSLSILGEESELDGAKAIEYEIPGEGARNLQSDFSALFPNLAGKPIQVGDTWTTEDNITEEGGGNTVNINTTTTFVLVGYEEIMGHECAKVRGNWTGTLSGEGEERGMSLTFSGDLQGTETFYFDFAKGILVKSETDGNLAGTIIGTGPQEITIPMERDLKIETKLVK